MANNKWLNYWHIEPDNLTSGKVAGKLAINKDFKECINDYICDKIDSYYKL